MHDESYLQHHSDNLPSLSRTVKDIESTIWRNLIIDDSIAYKIAKNSGLNVIRTLSILLKAKAQGIISEVRPLLDDMISKGNWYSKHVYETVLQKANEI